MIIYVVLLLFSTFDITTGATYTCDQHSTCGCSKRSTVILSKIIGGEPVSVSNPWGWIASLRRDDLHQCGASLISPMHAITAAHCVADITSLSRLSLNFGITKLSNIGQLRNVTKMYIHPEYDRNLFANDLAILRLHKPINLNNTNISLLCLPTLSDFNLKTAEYPPIGENVVAIGWGTTNPSRRVASHILRQVTVQTIGRTDQSCLNSINDDTLQFCAGLPEGGKDTCQGDSGGPLMLFRNGRWQLVGITSYGEICAASGFAGVYTRVAYYDSYIQNIIKSDDPYMINGRHMFDENKTSSSTNKFYHQSIIQLLIYLYILYRN